MSNEWQRLAGSYGAEFEKLWDMAVRLHGCTACAARALEAKAQITADALGSGMSVCGSGCAAEVMGRKVIFRTHLGPAVWRARGSQRIWLMGRLSSQMIAVWEAAVEFMSCPECIVAAVKYDIVTAEARANASIVGDETGIVGACRDCRGVQVGLV